MNAFTKLGKYLFVVPFVMFGLMHFTNGNAMAGIVPSYLPGGVIWVYITGLAQIAAAVSILAGKWDKLATVLLAVLLLIFVFLIHLPGAMSGVEATMQMSMSSILKDIGLAGGALMYADRFAKDNSYIG